MFDVRMDTAVGKQAPEMERAVFRSKIGEKCFQRRIRRQRPVGDRLVDPRQFLVNDPARAEFRCPTSLLPICPAGRPTSSPEALRRLWGQVLKGIREREVFASSGAFAFLLRAVAPFGLMPQPSRIIRATGFIST